MNTSSGMTNQGDIVPTFDNRQCAFAQFGSTQDVKATKVSIGLLKLPLAKAIVPGEEDRYSLVE